MSNNSVELKDWARPPSRGLASPPTKVCDLDPEANFTDMPDTLAFRPVLPLRAPADAGVVECRLRGPAAPLKQFLEDRLKQGPNSLAADLPHGGRIYISHLDEDEVMVSRESEQPRAHRSLVCWRTPPKALGAAQGRVTPPVPDAAAHAGDKRVRTADGLYHSDDEQWLACLLYTSPSPRD